jgi:hypothetical protein
VNFLLDTKPGLASPRERSQRPSRLLGEARGDVAQLHRIAFGERHVLPREGGARRYEALSGLHPLLEWQKLHGIREIRGLTRLCNQR